jgi:hypothetical protein
MISAAGADAARGDTLDGDHRRGLSVHRRTDPNPESLIRPDGKASALPGESLNPNILSASTLA